MRIPFLNLTVTNQVYKNELLKSIENVFDHGRIILGPEVEGFERSIAALSNKDYAIGMNSGTDALYLTLRA